VFEQGLDSEAEPVILHLAERLEALAGIAAVAVS
jgi:hypothetical protein